MIIFITKSPKVFAHEWGGGQGGQNDATVHTALESVCARLKCQNATHRAKTSRTISWIFWPFLLGLRPTFKTICITLLMNFSLIFGKDASYVRSLVFFCKAHVFEHFDQQSFQTPHNLSFDTCCAKGESKTDGCSLLLQILWLCLCQIQWLRLCQILWLRLCQILWLRLCQILWLRLCQMLWLEQR